MCKKITNYIRVVDYIVLSTLHQLLMSSLGDLNSDGTQDLAIGLPAAGGSRGDNGS